ncbi:FIG00950267: hypothetical protein [Pseudoalteromonas luteoviolacea B = ATCC 29581]|nr:FIG00950267: hypothetical protein [Pseudoalteromonas luteoviolacea B = ATCC 29581]
MKLIKIDKTRYRKHLNRVIIACILSLTVGSLGISQTLIVLFPSPDQSHFHWNLLGVMVSSVMIAVVLNKYRQHPFMKEVVYVWELKQALNLITRKMAKLKVAAQHGDYDALQAINYSYAGSRQLWTLDDNTITMEELAMWQREIERLAEQHNVILDQEAYDPKCLTRF